MEDKLNNEITNKLLAINKYLQHHKGRSRGQETILKVLENNGPMSQKQLQIELQVKPGSISEIVSKLEKQGYVLRTRNKDDARIIILSITEPGKKKLTEIKRKGEADIYENLSEEEKRQLLSLLAKIKLT